MFRHKCRKCSGKKFWRVRRSKLRCQKCGYEFVPKIGGINLARYRWKALLKWFLRCQSINVIIEETKISKHKILKALNLVRKAMILDVPEVFSGVVEVDETYLGGQWKYKRKSVKRKQARSKRGLGTTKQPVFGILTREGKVWATIVLDTEARDLVPIIEKRVEKGSRVNSDTWRAYTGLATRGYVHRTVEHRREEYARGTNHINGLEGFFGYLKRQLASRGGIRRERLPYYLAEYVWRYNHRDLPVEKQTQRLLNLVAKI